MCVSYIMITGNVKSKHKQYDNWHSQDFFNGGPKRGSETTERRKGPSLVWGRLTLKPPEKLQLYGLYVYYVVHICTFGTLRVKAQR